MNLTTIFLLTLCLSANAKIYSKRVNLSERNTSLEKIFREITSQAGSTFVSTRSLLKKAKDISLDVQNAPIERSYDICFKEQPFTYTNLNTMVIAKEKDFTALKEGVYNQVSLALNITGKITDDKGQPLEGATILVKGTKVGAKSDANGNFSINAEPNSTLVITYVGFESTEVKLGNQINITVQLNPFVAISDEVVVVGYTTKKLSFLTSSVSVVSGAQLNDVASNDITGMLQGKAPGVIVSNSSGDPNAGASIVIRGSGSINAGSSPLYVVDGIVGGSANPKDVESVTILKDAAATGLYGSRAANGVIIITTKTGKAGKTKINLSSLVGVNSAISGNFDVMNSQQLYDYEKSFYPVDRFANEIPASVLSQNTNWHDLAFRKGITQNYGISTSGGSDKTQFYIAGNYYNEEGTINLNSNETYNFRTNITHKINDRFKINVKFNGQFNVQNDDPSGLDGALYGSYINMPWDNPYNQDKTINKGTDGGWYGREQENFLHGQQYNINETKGARFVGDINLDYSIAQNLTISTYNRVSYNNSQSEMYYDVRSKAGKGLGRLSNGNNYNLSLITSNRLNYSRSFGKHKLDALAVAEAEKNHLSYNTVLGEGIAPGLHVINTASRILNATGNVNENSFSKGLLQLDYNFDNRYFAVGSIINESSSRFGTNNRSANFYTIGTSWILSNENFVKTSSKVDLLKIRASYGVTGNANIGDYQSLGVYSFATQYANNSGSFPSQMTNNDLTWEKAKGFNLGLDVGMFNRISLNIDVYDKTTQGLLLNVEKPYTSGFSSVIQNVGSIQNRGLEINLNTDNLRGEFNWKTNFNIAFNRSKVLSLVEDGKDIRQGNIIISSGQELYTWNMRKWLGVDPANGDPLWELISTGPNGQNIVSAINSYSDATQQNVGLASPEFTGGMSNTFTYKGLSLFAFFNFVSGNLVYNNTRALFDSDGAYYTFNSMVLADEWKRWEKPGDNATHPKSVFGGNKNSNKTSSRFLENGSYARLRNITLSYELPTRFLNKYKTANAKIFVSGDNLLTLTKFSGNDPEVALGPGGGTSSVKYPISRKILVGINVGL